MSEPANFLNYPSPGVDPQTAKAALIPVPYDGTASFRPGARHGPDAIVAASAHLEDYDLQLGFDPSQHGIFTAAPVHVDGLSAEQVVASVERAAEPWVESNTLLGILGGEHTVGVGAVRALARHHPDLSVIFLDAHADMRDSYQGNRYSHACTARRMIEICPLVQVGVRSADKVEWEWMQEYGVSVMQWPHRGWFGDAAIETLHKLDSTVYISLDLDVLDPSVMPAVGTPEPGGLTYTQLADLLEMVGAAKRIVGFDVTELAPSEGPVASSYTAAKLVYKIIGYALGKVRRRRARA